MIESAKLLPERIITGFAHLIWITMFGMVLLNISPSLIHSFFSNLNTGHVALIGSLIVGISYYLGNLIDWFIILIVASVMKILKMNPKPISELIRSSASDTANFRYLANIYIDKAFLRSIFLAGIGIILFSLCLDARYNSNHACLTILIIGGMIEVVNFITIFYLINTYSSLYDKLKSNNK